MTARCLHAVLLLALVSLAVSGAWGAAPTKRTLTLARDGQPAATIVLDRAPAKEARSAAYELQWHLQQISGATVPIAHDGELTSGVKVLVGESAATRALELTGRSFKQQEY